MTTTLAPPPRTTYREVLSEPRFRLLFLTRTLGIVADSLRITTLSVLVFATTGSPLLSALAFGAGFLPQLAGSLLLGGLADRIRPRRLISAGYALSCAVAVLLGLAPLPVQAVLLLVAVLALLTPVFSGASARLVAEALTGDAYVLGRSLSNMASSGAQLAGLAGGGIAVTLLGPRQALLVSAAAYLIAAVAVRARLGDLPLPPTAPGTAPARSWTVQRALLGAPRVRGLLLAQWLPSAFSAGAEGLVVAYAGRSGFPAGTAGPLLACLPIGMLVGDLAVGRFVRPALRERLVVPLVLLLGLPLLAFAASPAPVLCALLLVVSGAGFAYGLGLQRGFLEALPEDSRGQAFGLLSSGNMTFQGVCPLLFGLLAEAVPVGVAMSAAGVGVLLTAGYLRGVMRPGA
ncbi:MFS transporter [Streptacidiphilus sp. N1-3]|uniref:MFS transporter n=1 Tax=Streptacidiphilus alkalitolerans TaxID=3342712 RepID=A0ABV6WV31_9ACTN